MKPIDVLADAFAEIESKDEKVVAVLLDKDAKKVLSKKKKTRKAIKKKLLFGAKVLKVKLPVKCAFMCIGENGNLKGVCLLRTEEPRGIL